MHKETAEDITAESFMKALRYIKAKQPEILNPTGWIYKIATNELLLYHRKQQGKKTASLCLDEGSMEMIADTAHTVDKYMDFVTVKEMMMKLKPVERVLIELYYFEKKSYREIANITGMKEVTLRSRIHRILSRLKRLLQ